MIIDKKLPPYHISPPLCCQGDRMWGFVSSLLLAMLYPGSLLLPGIFGFLMTLVVATFGAAVGDWVDRTPRMRGQCWWEGGGLGRKGGVGRELSYPPLKLEQDHVHYILSLLKLLRRVHHSILASTSFCLSAQSVPEETWTNCIHFMP